MKRDEDAIKTDSTGVVVVAFDDLLRAEQAARAADLWRSANRTLPVGPITVIGRTVSGSVAVETRGMVRPRSGARAGFWIGFLVAGLPAAGIGGFVGWLFGAVVTALLSLTGLIGDDAATFITLAIGAGGVVVAGLLAGLAGGIVGMAAGALIGWIDSRSSGFTSAQMSAMASGVPAGDAIVAVSAGVATIPLVTDELLRLGGTPRQAPSLEAPPAPGDGTGKPDG